MTQPRNAEHHTKTPLKPKDYRADYRANRIKGDPAALAGRSAYRQDFERNYGPDLDEWLDATESGTS